MRLPVSTGIVSLLSLSIVAYSFGVEDPPKQPQQMKKSWMPRADRNIPDGAIQVERRPGQSGSLTFLPLAIDMEKLLLKFDLTIRDAQWREAAEVCQTIIEETDPHWMIASEEHLYDNARGCIERRMMTAPPEFMKAYRQLAAERSDVAVDRAIRWRDDKTLGLLAEDFGLSEHGERLLYAAGAVAMERGEVLEANVFFRRLLDLYPQGRLATAARSASTLCGSELGLLPKKEEASGAPDRYSAPMAYYLPQPDDPDFSRRRWQWTIPSATTTGKPAERKRDRDDQLKRRLNGTLKFADDYYASLSVFIDAHLPTVEAGNVKYGKGEETIPVDAVSGKTALKDSGGRPEGDSTSWNAVVGNPSAVRVSNILRRGSLAHLCVGVPDASEKFQDISLCLLDLGEQRLLWRKKIFSVSRAQNFAIPIMLVGGDGGETTYLSSGSGQIFAIDSLSGVVRWIREYPSMVDDVKSVAIRFSSDTPMPQRRVEFVVRNLPCVESGGLLVTAPWDLHAAIALEAATGRSKWSFPMEPASLALFEGVAGGKVIISMKGVIAIDLQTGKELWRWKNEEIHRWGKGLLTDKAFYMPTWSGVYRVRLADGNAERIHTWENPQEEAGSILTVGSTTVTVTLRGMNGYGPAK